MQQIVSAFYFLKIKMFTVTANKVNHTNVAKVVRVGFRFKNNMSWFDTSVNIL